MSLAYHGLSSFAAAGSTPPSFCLAKYIEDLGSNAALAMLMAGILSAVAQLSAAAQLPDVYYDAETSYFTGDGTRQVFSGSVVFIGGGYLLAADSVSIDRQEGMLEASGHVLVAGEEQTLTADKARYWLQTGDFVITAAQLILADRAESMRVREEILSRGNDHKSHRQHLWQQTRHAGRQVSQSYYLKFRSQLVTRKAQNELRAREAYLTPCRCTEDEPPAFAVRARRIVATVDKQVDFNDAVVEITGLPVFFLPFLRLPLKRKSGLLLPLFGYRQRTGASISQPLYLSFNDKADATFYFDWLQRRGVRLAASSRARLSEQHHWQLWAEGLHDRAAEQDEAPSWRGTLKWQRLHFITARLSFGSEGDLSSDVNYNSSLYRERRGEFAFELSPYATRRLWLHLDHPDFYAGISGHLAGDREHFTRGAQLPANFTLQSRHFKLLNGEMLKTWVYLHLQQQHRGTWQELHTQQRARLRAVNVLVGKALDIEQFGEIEAQRLSGNQLHTWRTGLRVGVPLDGRMSLPAHKEQTRTLRHLLRFDASLIVQPQVWTQGNFQAHAMTQQELDNQHPSAVLELALEQDWQLSTQNLPITEMAGPQRNHYVHRDTQTPVSMRLSTSWERRQAWSPVHLDLRVQHGALSLQQELTWNMYRQKFETLRLALSVLAGDRVQFKPSWEIMPQMLADEVQQRVQVRRLGMVAQVARRAELQAEYAERAPLDIEGQWQYRWQIGAEYRGQQQCWGLAFSRVKDWDEREREASYMLSLQVNFVNSPYDEELP